MPAVAGILLTGGASRRFGRDKSLFEIDGETLATRTARLLQRVAAPVIEVGPGVSGCPSVVEVPRGGGPLAAVAAGNEELRARGSQGDALVIACDMPLLSEPLLRLLAEFSPPGTVIPVVCGQPQPLCARWGAGDMARCRDLLAAGARSLRHLATQPSSVLIDESVWGGVADEWSFADLDHPQDVTRLGIRGRHATGS